MEPMNRTLLDDIQRKQAIAQEYADYSQNRGGLGKVLGGIVGLIVILAGTILGPGLLTGLLTVVVTLIWLVGKEAIRRTLYRGYGQAHAKWPRNQRNFHRGLTVFVTLVSVFVFVSVLISEAGQLGEQAGRLAYLFFIALAPFITWRFLRTPLEFIVGVFLLAACAVHAAGGAYTLTPPAITPVELGMAAATWSPFIGAIGLIVVGIREHRRFQRLSRILQGREEQAEAISYG